MEKKSIMELDAVRKALSKVVSESDVKNGTNGMEFYCHYWSSEDEYDADRAKLLNDMASATLLGNHEAVIKTRKLIDGLPKPKVIMEFRLIQAIPLVRGTKTMVDGEKRMGITANNVKSIFIREVDLLSQLAEFEETDQMAKDLEDKDTPIIKLSIIRGILDVKEAIVDARDRNKPDNLKRIARPQRVYLTAVSYHAMQVLGRLKANEERAANRRFGYDVI